MSSATTVATTTTAAINNEINNQLHNFHYQTLPAVDKNFHIFYCFCDFCFSKSTTTTIEPHCHCQLLIYTSHYITIYGVVQHNRMHADVVTVSICVFVCCMSVRQCECECVYPWTCICMCVCVSNVLRFAHLAIISLLVEFGSSCFRCCFFFF